jgi:DNA-binding transcriptional LysR family regulator
MTRDLIAPIRNGAALRYFQAVARSGSFRRAAEEVRIAPSAVSRQVRLLEAELGVALLERGHDGARPTAAGEVLLYRLGRAAQELAVARAEIRALQGARRGHVTLGANETVAREFLANFLLEFRDANPAITLDIVVGNTTELLRQLIAGELEVMVGYGVPRDSAVAQVVAFELVTCLMVHRHHHLVRRASVRVSDMLQETMILPDASSHLRRTLDALFTQLKARPPSALTTNSFELMANLVGLGLGVGVQIRLAPGGDPLRPDLVYVPVAERSLQPVSLACCVPAARPPSRVAALCIKALGKALQEWCAPVSAHHVANSARDSGVGG